MDGYNLEGVIGEVNQHGYVVMDAGKAAIEWFEKVGAGPFYIGDFTLEGFACKGRSLEPRLRIAVGYWGSIQVELIQPLDAPGTIYEEVLPREDGQLNHLAIPVTDIDAWLKDHDAANKILHSGEMRQSGVRFVYIDRYLPGGLHLELVQAPPAMLAMYGAIARYRTQWDGTEPLRPMDAIQKDLAAAGLPG